MKNIFSLAALVLLSGCSQHYHTLKITSEPSAQLIEDIHYQEDGLFSKEEKIITNDGWAKIDQKRTPYEITLPGETSEVTVTLGGQTKKVSFAHGLSEVRTVCEPFLGLPLLEEKVYSFQLEKQMHFDIAPVQTRRD